MKIKNLYLILLAVLFIASSCSENTDLNPILPEHEILSQEINDQRSEWVNNWDDCQGDDCSVYTWQEGAGGHVNFDGSSGFSNAGSTTNGLIKSIKWKNGKALVDYSYFVANGYTVDEMTEFQIAFQMGMSDSEFSIYSGSSLTKAQRSCYVLNARIAIDKANQSFPGFKRNSKGHALRQGIASALNAKCLGVSLTKQLQDAHYTRTLNPYHADEIAMMQDNDAFGRSLIIPWAPPSSNNTLINQVIYARANGGLYYLTPLNINNRPNSSTNKVSTADSSGGPGAGDDCDDGDGSAGGVVGMC